MTRLSAIHAAWIALSLLATGTSAATAPVADAPASGAAPPRGLTQKALSRTSSGC